MKKITIGIIAHVDSGKTTLSEALLYLTGTIRKFGRVDKGASFLDNDHLERRRGITIYSKQARFSYGNTEFILIDTPGHADFSAEMERTLNVLDYAVLLISAADGINGRCRQLWDLLSYYEVPAFIFFNKMDQDGADKQRLLSSFKASLCAEAVDFSDRNSEEFHDSAAMCSEEAMESYLQNGKVSDEIIRNMIAERSMFPCLFGSALKQEGILDLANVLDEYTLEPVFPEEFAARVYKILRDADGSRLTMIRVTGGTLKNKTMLPDGNEEGNLSKINQIRLYNGNKYELAEEAKAGEICALAGLKESFAGQGFGTESGTVAALMTPILSYRAILEDQEDPVRVFPYFKTIEEENPELKAVWDEDRHEISVSVMGKVQIEILEDTLLNRFGLKVSFDTGRVMYRETIAKPVIGAGHFEPLRHYAEAVLLMQPLPRGEGLVFESAVRTEKLAKNWQRLILTHLEERQHRGVLTGSAITDMKITLIAGRAHLKHTEGGDFRQAVYRAVRQGLMMAESILLEPYYRFILEIPSAFVGKAMTDLDRMHAQFGSPDTGSDPDYSVLGGRAPVSEIQDYPSEIAAFTKGAGHISFFNDGYDLCVNPQEVMLQKGYDPLADLRNTPDSVFCAHGSGYIVPYDEVYAHLDIQPSDFLDDMEGDDSGFHKALESAKQEGLSGEDAVSQKKEKTDTGIGTEEIDAIIAKVAQSNSRDKKLKTSRKRKFGTTNEYTGIQASGISSQAVQKPSRIFSIEEASHILVDGYNVIFAWPELSDLARTNIDSARDALIDLLSRFQSMIHAKVICVFDAYRVRGHATEHMMLQDVELIFTGEEETADQYIEKFTNVNGKKKKIVVVTSDGLEQIITQGQGCMLISSRDLKKYMDSLSSGLREKYGVSIKV